MSSDSRNFENVPIVWTPTGEIRESAEKFKQLIREKYEVEINNYWDLHRWTVEHVPEFWSEVWDFVGIKYSRRFDEVIDLRHPPAERPEWFKGAKLNFAENLLRFKDDEVALVITGEERKTHQVTYAEVYENVRLYAAAFRKVGLQRGDVVVGYMSNREEPLYAMTAATSIGAIWSGALPLLGAKPTINRFKQVKPKLLLTMDRFRHNKEEKEKLPKILEISKEILTLEKIIIVSTKKETTADDIKHIRNSCFLDDFLQLGYDNDGQVPPLHFEQLSFSHPLFISYTSGTTGLPKALVHGSGGLLSIGRDYFLHNVGGREVSVLSVSPVGWASWNLISMHLFAGIKLILFEGVPFFLSPTYIWDMVDEFKIRTLFFTPNLLDKLEKDNTVPTKNHSLESLKVIVSGGAVVKPQNYDFVYNKIKKDILFASGYGSTELMGAALVFDMSLPIYRGENSCPCFGVDIECLDEAGESLSGEVGELVIKTPVPSMPLGLWGDEDGSMFKDTYFSKFPDKFALGDLGLINPVTKGLVIYGRSDETLKPKGVRFGSSEIYNIVNQLPEIQDSICVAQFSKDRVERAVLFVKMSDDCTFGEPIIEKIKAAINMEMSSGYVPELILETRDVPYNMNGKKMEITVKKMINNMPYNADTIINKESLENFKNIPPYIP